jgi:hypothetical protein
MAFGQMPFPVRQAIGTWAENTVVRYFSETPNYVAIPYGERWSGKKKAITDAVNRPDLLLLSNEAIEQLRNEDVLLTSLDLKNLNDNDKMLMTVVDKATVALETKISFRYYEKGHVCFIIDELRRKRYETWLQRTRNVGCLVIWFTLNKAFIAAMDDILSRGKEEERTYEGRSRMARVKKTINLHVEETDFFADVNGVKLNETLRPVLKRGTSGSITINIEDDVGILRNVNMEALERLAVQVRRPS